MSSRPCSRRWRAASSIAKASSRPWSSLTRRRSRSTVTGTRGSRARAASVATRPRAARRQQAVGHGVAAEDVGERRRDHGAEAVVGERPGRVLARRAAAEIGAGQQNRRAGVARVVEDELGTGAAVGAEPPVVEQIPAEAGALDALQELLRDDLIGVDVAAQQRQRRGRGGRETAPSAELPARTSAKWPRIAAAAAIAGLTRCVRPPRPWRPSKLRLLVDADRSPGLQHVGVHAQAHRAARLAPFEAGVAEDAVEPFVFGRRLDPLRAGHDHRVHAAGSRDGRARPAPPRADPRSARWCTSR